MINYYDPIFCIASEKMPFNIRIEVRLNEKIDRAALEYAANTAIKRYPYFSIKAVIEGNRYAAVPNDKPLVVYYGDKVYPMGSDDVNGHFVAFSYKDNEICFYASHIITDGSGFYPFVKTVLYYYICKKYGKTLDSTGIQLADSPFYDDELGNPYSDGIDNCEPLYIKEHVDHFRLCDGGYVNDSVGTVFRFKVRQDAVMSFSRDHDGSPCALLSVLMAKAIGSVHENIDKSIVSAVSFNMRSGLGNRHSYRMLCSALMLEYTPRLMSRDSLHMCTCSRGMITLQSQNENVLYTAGQRKKLVEKMNNIGSLEERKQFCGQTALADSVDNTFSISYVGKLDFGCIEPYIDSIYNITDGSTYKTAFVEVSSVKDYFDIALIQGFSSDVYFKAFLKQFDKCGIPYTADTVSDMNIPGTVLP